MDLEKNEGFSEKPQEETKKSFVPIFIALILLALVGVLFFAAAYFREEKNFVFYLEEGALYCSDLKGEPRLLSDEMGDVSGENVRLFVSQDEKLLYRDGEGETGTLYFLDLSRSADPVPVEESVEQFFVSSDFSAVVYTKGRNLYRWDFEKKECLFSHWEEEPYLADSRLLVWKGAEGKTFVSDFYGAQMDLGAGVSEVMLSENGSVCYYLRDGNLCARPWGGEEKAVAESVGDLLSPWGEEGILYLWKETLVSSLYSFVTDDFAEYDRNLVSMELPQEPKSPSYGSYPSPQAYEAAREAYQKEYARYQEDMEAYRENEARLAEKAAREELRNGLKLETVTSERVLLARFDGEKEVLLTVPIHALEWQAERSDSGETALVRIQTDVLQELLSLSEVQSVRDVRETLKSERQKAPIRAYLLGSGGISEEEIRFGDGIQLSPDGSSAAVFRAFSEDAGELTVFSVQGGIRGDKIFSLENVTADYWEYLSSGKVVAFCGVKEGEGELFLNGISLAEKAKAYGYYYHKESDSLLYFIQWNGESQTGTAVLFREEKEILREEFVYSAQFLPNGSLITVTRSSSEKKGELCCYNGERKIPVAPNVRDLVPATVL